MVRILGNLKRLYQTPYLYYKYLINLCQRVAYYAGGLCTIPAGCGGRGHDEQRERDGDAFLPCPALPALPACLLASFAYLLDKKNSVEIEMAKVR